MKLLQTILYVGLSWVAGITVNAAAAAGAGHYTIPEGNKVVITETAKYWDYPGGRSFEDVRTKQYGFIDHHDALKTRFYTTPAIHKYHGAGSITQPIYFNMPPEAYSNLPAAIKAIVAPGDNIDIVFLVTLVQDWYEEDGGNRPLSIRPHHWNDPSALYALPGYKKEFPDEIGIFDPTPPELRVAGTVGMLYPMVETTHSDEIGRVISSGPTDYLEGGYTHNPGEEPNLNLCFWSVVKGPVHHKMEDTTMEMRTAITLHWVTSDHSLPAIDSLTDVITIADWARNAEGFGVFPPCAERLRTLLGI